MRNGNFVRVPLIPRNSNPTSSTATGILHRYGKSVTCKLLSVTCKLLIVNLYIHLPNSHHPTATPMKMTRYSRYSGSPRMEPAIVPKVSSHPSAATSMWVKNPQK